MRSHWDVIEEFLPDYQTNETVTFADITMRVIDEEPLSEQDVVWFSDYFGESPTKHEMQLAYRAMTRQLYYEALEAKKTKASY